MSRKLPVDFTVVIKVVGIDFIQIYSFKYFLYSCKSSQLLKKGKNTKKKIAFFMHFEWWLCQFWSSFLFCLSYSVEKNKNDQQILLGKKR